jgi:HEPN domain-containing protein
LKAFLAFHDITFVKTHNLLQLLELGKQAAKDAEILRPALAVLNDYAVLVRYPDERFEPKRKDAKEAFEFAGQVKHWVEGKVGRQHLP